MAKIRSRGLRTLRQLLVDTELHGYTQSEQRAIREAIAELDGALATRHLAAPKFIDAPTPTPTPTPAPTPAPSRPVTPPAAPPSTPVKPAARHPMMPAPPPRDPAAAARMKQQAHAYVASTGRTGNPSRIA